MTVPYFPTLPDVIDIPLLRVLCQAETASVGSGSFDASFFEDSQLEDIQVEENDDEVSVVIGHSTGELGPMSRARHWCFTLNNYDDEAIERIAGLEGHVTYLVYGKEVGASGTPHLQGFVTFPDRVRRATAIDKIGQAHFTVARFNDQAIAYCKKDGDFVEFGTPPKGPGRRNDLEDFKTAVCEGQLDVVVLRADHSEVFAKYPRFCIDFVEDNRPKRNIVAHPLRDWQQTLYHDLLLPPDDRRVTFIVDVVGNSGKSWFCHYYSSIHENTQVILPGRKADMTYVLSSSIRVLFIDAPRSKQGEFIQYDFLEDVKNGYIFSTKYESRIKTLEKVHVVVMMNEMPDQGKLSADRYDVRIV